MHGACKSRKVKFAAAVVTFMALTAPCIAHDYWLAQQPPTLDVGDTCVLRLLVGDEFQPELERPLQRDLTTRFEWLTGGESFDLLDDTRAGAQPVLERQVANDGTALVVMDRSFVLTEGTYQRFVKFLEHEGATELAREVGNVAKDTALRRRYARNLKALVRVGKGGGQPIHDRRVGQELEIVLLEDPWSVDLGAKLAAKILFRGEPVAGLHVKRLVKLGNGSVATSSARTDANGVVRFVFEDRGSWLIRATLIRPSDEREEADWDTYYATFSFVTPDEGGR